MAQQYEPLAVGQAVMVRTLEGLLIGWKPGTVEALPAKSSSRWTLRVAMRGEPGRTVLVQRQRDAIRTEAEQARKEKEACL